MVTDSKLIEEWLLSMYEQAVGQARLRYAAQQAQLAVMMLLSLHGSKSGGQENVETNDR